jgi:cytochrome P450
MRKTPTSSRTSSDARLSTDDLTSDLVAAEMDGERLDDEEIVGFVGCS